MRTQAFACVGFLDVEVDVRTGRRRGTDQYGYAQLNCCSLWVFLVIFFVISKRLQAFNRNFGI